MMSNPLELFEKQRDLLVEKMSDAMWYGKKRYRQKHVGIRYEWGSKEFEKDFKKAQETLAHITKQIWAAKNISETIKYFK